MGGAITVSERILFHLNSYVKYEDKYEVPFDVTQDGISQACQISRAHAAIELKKLRATGIVEERLSHVRKGKSRRKAYFLTFEGKSKAATVFQYVKDNDIDPMVDPSKVAPDMLTPAHRFAKRSSPMPPVKAFFGRENDLEKLREALASPSAKVVSVRGIAGIGKTTLVAKLASELSGQRVFWYSAKPWDSPRRLAEAMGGFMSENGSKKLSSYLASGKFDLGEISYVVNQALYENGYTFVIDDADCCQNLQEFLSMFKHSSGPSKMVITAEQQPAFYDHVDVVAKNEVAEFELSGLDKAAAVELLGSRGISGETAEELATATKGHPLSLEMVTESGREAARYQVSRFFEDKFYSALSEDEKAILQLASVFERPLPAEAIPRELRHARKGSILRETAPGRFEIHASLRGFVYGLMTREERAKWHSYAADFYLREGDLRERLVHLIRSGRTLEAEITVSRLGDALLEEGNVQRLWGVLESFAPAKEKYKHSVMLVKARAANLVGRYDASWEILEQIVKESEGAMKAEALVEMGRIRSKKVELEAASKLFAEAMEHVRDAPVTRAKALRGLGVVESKLGNYGKAQEFLEASARDSMSVMDSKGMLLAHLELGNVLIGRGMYEDAIDHFSKSAAGFGPVDLANVYVNMGIACAHLGRSDEARLHLENAVRLSDETGQARSKAYALASLAEVLTKSGNAEAAKEHCFSAIEVFSDLGDRLGLSAAYANLGMAERTGGNLQGGEDYYRESLAALEGMEVPRSLALRKMEYALLLEEKGERARASEELRASHELLQGIGADDMLAKVDSELQRLKDL